MHKCHPGCSRRCGRAGDRVDTGRFSNPSCDFGRSLALPFALRECPLSTPSDPRHQS